MSICCPPTLLSREVIRRGSSPTSAEGAGEEPSRAGSELRTASSVLSHQDRLGQQPGLLLDPLSWEGFLAEEGPGPVDRAVPQEGHTGEVRPPAGSQGLKSSPSWVPGTEELPQEQGSRGGCPQGQGRAHPPRQEGGREPGRSREGAGKGQWAHVGLTEAGNGR